MKPQLMKLLKSAGVLALRLALAVAVAAIVLTGACIWMEGDIAEVMTAFFLSPFEDEYVFAEILTEMVPLIFTGIAVSLMVRCGQFNMFVEGAFFGGAFIAGVLAPALGEHFLITPIVAILAGTVAMALIGYVPAKMKASLGVNEFVSSLMLNYIIYWIVMYLLHGPAADPDNPDTTRYLEDLMRLPLLNEDLEVSSNLLIALLMAVCSGLFLFKTRWGYALRMTGDNPSFAVYSGIKAQGYVVSSQVIGSGLAGMGGAAFLLGNKYRFDWKALPNYGFDGFVIASIAGNNPYAVPLAALFLGYLRVGARQVSMLGDIPNEVIHVIQAIIIILFGAQFVISRRRKKGGRKHA